MTADEWMDAVRPMAVRRGTVGDVEWLVTPSPAMPSLNGYLVLPESHPWLKGDGYDDAAGWEEAPREYTFREGRVVGIDSGHYNDHWPLEELKAHVKPWPERWALLEEVMPSWFTMHERHPDPWGGTTTWSVDLWTHRVMNWAGAAVAAVYPVSTMTDEDFSAVEHDEGETDDR